MAGIDEIKNLIAGKLRITIEDMHWASVAGGSINSAYSITTKSKKYFCKVNKATSLPGMMACEEKGLQLLAHQNIIRVPETFDVGENETLQFIVMEFVATGIRTKFFWDTFGKQLAALHHVKHATHGLTYNNYIGSLPQDNTQHNLWHTFFLERRIQPQVKMAVQNRLLTNEQATAFEKLYLKLPTIFPAEQSSLLHGDLWSGNFLCDGNEKPVLIDPAVYYGSRHMDLAMTTLFGGFDNRFYDSYHYYYPLPANYKILWEVCNLYPLLVHLNLFGKSYLGQVLEVLKKFR